MTETIINDTENRKEVKVRCEVWSRCVGYLRPVQDYNIGLKQQFKDRKTYKMPKENTDASSD